MSRFDASTFSDLERFGALDLAAFRPWATCGPSGWKLARQLLERERSLLGIAELASRGEGAHSWVFRASQPALDRAVAIKVGKVAPPHARFDPLELQARGMARLDHPSIPRVLAHGYLGVREASYLILPWVEGPSLAERLDDPTRPLAVAELLAILRELASALRHAHARGVVHGDLRPANVILPTSGERAAVLLDWHGPVHAQETEGGASSCIEGQGTRASEPAASQLPRLTPASDLLDLGALLAEALHRTIPPVPPALHRFATRDRATADPQRHAAVEEVASVLAEFVEHDPCP